MFYLFHFDFNFLTFLFLFEFNHFYSLQDNLLFLYCLNSASNDLLFIASICLNDFYLFLILFVIFFCILRSFFFSKINFGAKIFNYDSLLLINFLLFLIKIDKKYKLFNLLPFFLQNKISPYILLNELDFLIRLKKIENDKIKTILSKH